MIEVVSMCFKENNKFIIAMPRSSKKTKKYTFPKWLKWIINVKINKVWNKVSTQARTLVRHPYISMSDCENLTYNISETLVFWYKVCIMVHLSTLPAYVRNYRSTIPESKPLRTRRNNPFLWYTDLLSRRIS